MPPAPAPRRTSVWTWVFAGLSVLLVLGVGGLGYLYNEARGTVADQKIEIASLEDTVDAHATTIAGNSRTIRDREQALTKARNDAQVCPDAVRQALRATNEATFRALFDKMVTVCTYPPG